VLYRRLHSLPSQDPDDPGYRRLRYCRYADDTLLGFAGPKAKAEQIKQRLTAFLREQLNLNLAQDKTLITHARTGAALDSSATTSRWHVPTAEPADHREPTGATGDPSTVPRPHPRRQNRHHRRDRHRSDHLL